MRIGLVNCCRRQFFFADSGRLELELSSQTDAARENESLTLFVIKSR